MHALKSADDGRDAMVASFGNILGLSPTIGVRVSPLRLTENVTMVRTFASRSARRARIASAVLRERSEEI